MVLLKKRKIVAAVLRNQAHRLIGGALRGGHCTSAWTEPERRRHGEKIWATLSPHLGPVKGQTGLEVGPGDNLSVCVHCIEHGATRMYAVEQYAGMGSVPPKLQLILGKIEDTRLPEPVDFAYSNDVFEHVLDVPGAMRAIYAALKPGGRFVSSIDLRGHNAFGTEGRPLDFLTCPDWLYDLMGSHIVTSNRLRAQDFEREARSAGFEVEVSRALACADMAYVREVLPQVLPRYRLLGEKELATLQFLLVLRKRSTASSCPDLAR
jgi:SAM-dependent methyltransferase